MLGWYESHNMEGLKQALRNIVCTPIEFNIMEDGSETWDVMSLLAHANIKNGICTYKYIEELAERLFDPEVYATINLGIQKLLR